MDVRIEAAPMAAEATAVTPSLVVTVGFKALSKHIAERVASFSCPSMGSHSISAVAPDHTNFRKELPEAA